MMMRYRKTTANNKFSSGLTHAVVKGASEYKDGFGGRRAGGRGLFSLNITISTRPKAKILGDLAVDRKSVLAKDCIMTLMVVVCK